MKMGVMAAALVATALSASAKITVVWTTGWEVMDFGGGTLPAGAIAQLIYSPTATSSAPSGSDPLLMTGDNILLGTFVFSGSDGYIDPSVSFIPADGYLDSGNVSYGLLAGTPTVLGAGVFTRAFNSSTTPTYYGEGGWDIALAEQLPTPQAADISNMAESSNFILTTPIPEPGAGILVLAGAMVAVWRRRRQDD